MNSINARRFAEEFASEAVTYKETPVKLRAGGESHWYIDARTGLSRGRLLKVASELMIASANTRGRQREIVAGMGIGGSALVSGIALNDSSVQAVWGNDRRDFEERYGYGLHGALFAGKNIWIVDDTATTGNSLVTLIQMMRDKGGIVTEASVLTDRSQGRVAEPLGEIGVEFSTLLVFDESSGEMQVAT